MLNARQRTADRRASSRRWSARCASAPGSRRAPAPSGAASTAASSARAGRRRSSRFRDGPITAQTIPALVERFHAAYERRYGNRFPYVPVQGVSYRVELVVPSEKLHAGGARRRRRRRAAAPAAHDRAAPPRVGERCEAAEYVRAQLPAGRADRRPGRDPRGPLDDARLPAPARATVGALGELVIAAQDAS